MEILALKAFGAPNIYSLKKPVVSMRVKLGELCDVATKDIKNMNDNIIKLFPDIYEHKCTEGYEGGFVKRLRDGTYLPHVTEHLCIETQRMLGFDISYGKARQIKDDLYNIVFEVFEPKLGEACAAFVVDVLNKLVSGKEVNMEEGMRRLNLEKAKYDLGVSTKAIVDEAKKRGIPVSFINQGEVVRLGYGKYQKLFSATLYEATSGIAVDIACNKELTKALLEEARIPTPRGKAVATSEEALLIAKEIAYPVVVKPNSGNKGKFVFTNIKNETELKDAFSEALAFGGEVLVEEYIEGKDYRVLVVDGKFVAAAERIPANVIGDGRQSVSKLIEMENQSPLRGDDHEKPLTKIKIDSGVEELLASQNLSLNHVPQKGETVWLRRTANLSTGGQAHDCSDIVCPKNKELFEMTAKLIGLDIAGIDVTTQDISKPILEVGGAIVEVNAAPGIRMHLNPSSGVKRDVASPIIDMMFPDGTPSAIPILSVTGTNGKTTTVRMISNILKKSGLLVGMTTTGGIYINDTCIEEGDTTGPRSAKRILNSRNVEAAVLETARGGILKGGLAYKEADVAVFTNLTGDHIGVDGINTMEDLLHVKSLVVEAVKPTGACVLNADDSWVMKLKDKIKCDTVLFSMDEKNPSIIEHVASGKMAIYLSHDSIYISNKGVVRKLMNVKDIPATLGGRLKHNVRNSMAAVGACFALGVGFDIVERALSNFANNPGRFNIYDKGKYKVVFDYAHNVDGYGAAIDGLRALNPCRLVGVVGVPGDRPDNDILKVGKTCGDSFDYIIIKEDNDLRGRRELEVAKLLYDGALSGGISAERVEIVPDEKKALSKAIINAQEGDAIAVFFEKMGPLLELVDGGK